MVKTPEKFWDGEKYLYGAAAQQAYIKYRGGWKQHHETFGLDVLATRIALEKMNNQYNKPNLKRVK